MTLITKEAMHAAGAIELGGRMHVPLRTKEDYFRLLGEFDQLARDYVRIKTRLGPAIDACNRIPVHHRQRIKLAQIRVSCYRELAHTMDEEIERLRPIVKWESEYGRHGKRIDY